MGANHPLQGVVRGITPHHLFQSKSGKIDTKVITDLNPFIKEPEFLSPRATETVIAAQTAVRGNDPMTRNCHRISIRVNGIADCPGCLGTAGQLSHLGISSHPTPRDRCDRSINPFLESHISRFVTRGIRPSASN